jgi:hypothetical protein
MMQVLPVGSWVPLDACAQAAAVFLEAVIDDCVQAPGGDLY